MSTPDDDQRPRPMHAEPGYARHGAAIDRLMHASLAGLRRGQPATRRRRGSGPALRTATRLRDWLAALRRRRSPAVLPGATRVQAGMAARTDTLAHWSRRAAASNGFGAAEVAANDARYDDAAWVARRGRRARVPRQRRAGDESSPARATLPAAVLRTRSGTCTRPAPGSVRDPG